MRVAIRCDASPRMGTGHVRRMAALAHALLAEGHAVRFVSRDLGVDPDVMLPEGAQLSRLPAPDEKFAPDPCDPPHADWAGVGWERDAKDTATVLADVRPDLVVVDHYAFDARWHDAMREATGAKIVAVDDMADRDLACDLLVDHNYASDHRVKYATHLPDDTRICGGPDFALLAPAYADAPRHEPCDEVRSIGIFIGGTDADDVAGRVLDTLDTIGYAGPVELVATSASVHLAALLERAATDPRLTLSQDLPDLAAFLARHDLQVGGGGGATWERCCIGAPTLALAIADNQVPVLAPIAELGAVAMLDIREGLRTLPHAIAALIGDAASRTKLAATARTLVDGRGSARVVAAMEEL